MDKIIDFLLHPLTLCLGCLGVCGALAVLDCAMEDHQQKEYFSTCMAIQGSDYATCHMKTMEYMRSGQNSGAVYVAPVIVRGR